MRQSCPPTRTLLSILERITFSGGHEVCLCCLSKDLSWAILVLIVQPASEPRFWEWAGSLFSGTRAETLVMKRDEQARPLKPPTSVPEQIELLRSRGMAVDDELASQWLEAVLYYRLSAYWYPLRRVDTEEHVEDGFVPGADFADVVALYEADRKLRTLIHDGMERIEVGLRSRLTSLLCRDNALGYQERRFYRSGFDLDGWLRTARRRVDRAGAHNTAIDHYKKQYGGQYPFWVLSEVLDFGDVSKLYQGLTYKAQAQIAETFGITIDLGVLSKNERKIVRRRHPLASWFEQLTIVRNTCAHHGRLWNKSFVPASTKYVRTIPGLESLPDGQSERIYGAVLFMAHLLNILSPGTSWPVKVNNHIANCFLTLPMVKAHSLGITSNQTIHPGS